MLRAASSNVARRALQRSLPRSARVASFHASPRREDKEEESPSDVVAKDGFLGTGLSHLYAIPVGVALAVPMLEFNWYLVNEETLLASTFLAFCVVAYTQGGDMLSKALKDESKAMLAVQNEAEDKVIAKMEENLEYMKLTENIVDDYQAVLALTQESYDKLNAAGKIKPQHKLRAQVDKMLTLIANEEQNVYEKAKLSLMKEATEAVMAEFAESKDAKKAALDAAMAKLSNKPVKDPVQQAYLKFFKAKAEAAKKADDGADAAAAREAMVAKLNATAENEGMYFRLDPATGAPKLVA